jgi:tetratricopeptide (TPR) repeat protein
MMTSTWAVTKKQWRLWSGAFRIADDYVHQDPNDQLSRGRLADAGVNLANALRHSDARRALGVYDHTLLHLAEVRNNSSFRRFEVSALVGSSYALRRLGRPAEARQRLDAAFERLTQLKLYPSPKVELGSEAEETLRALADFEAGNGAFPRAIEIYQKLLDQDRGRQARPRDPSCRRLRSVEHLPGGGSSPAANRAR